VKISTTQSDLLNLTRWVAAWLVLAEHARSLCFVDYSQLSNPGLLAKAFYLMTGFGHESVLLFFVISGYLVGGKALALFRAGKFDWKRFLADRISRLYAVLGFALVLGWVLDSAGLRWFNGYGLYNEAYSGGIAVLNYNVSARLDMEDFLVNAVFLQTIFGPTSAVMDLYGVLPMNGGITFSFPPFSRLLLRVLGRRVLLGLSLSSA